MCGVTRAEEAFSADEQFGIVVAPKNTAAILECVQDPSLGRGHCLDYIKAATDVERTALISQRSRLFDRQRITISRGIVLDIAAGGLINQPFADVTLDGPGAFGKFARCHRT